MMDLITLFQSAQNGNRVLNSRLANKDLLEPAFQGRVFFYVLAVFVKRGGADTSQFTAGQSGLEHIGCILGALGCAGSDHGMEFVYK